MMLSPQQIEALLQMLSHTQSEELTCDEYLDQLAEYVETYLSGSSLPEGLRAIEQHLGLCNDCQEEFQTLLSALED